MEFPRNRPSLVAQCLSIDSLRTALPAHPEVRLENYSGAKAKFEDCSAARNTCGPNGW